MRFPLDVMSKVQDVKKSSLTFAPEAGSQRLRDVINKGLTEEVILAGSRERPLTAAGTVSSFILCWDFRQKQKEDMEGIAELAEKVARSLL